MNRPFLLSSPGQQALRQANQATGGPWIFARDSAPAWANGLADPTA